MPRPARRRALVLTTFLALAPASGRADTAITQLATWSGRVSYVATGNTMAASSTGGNLDLFAQPSTVIVPASSIPADAQLVQAYVYWSGTVNRAGTATSPNCGGFTLDRDIELSPPGWTRAPERVVADDCRCSAGSTSYDVQSCRADISGLVDRAGGGLTGPWTATGFIARLTGASTDNASFSIVLVYRSPTLRPRRIALYDGLVTMFTNAKSLTLGGLKIDDPPQGDLTWYALEGDAIGPSSTGESVTVHGSPGGRSMALSDASNPAEDPVNSTINTVSPARTGVTGVDIDRFDIAGALTAADSAVRMDYTAGADKYWLVYNIVGVNVYEAVLAATSTLTAELHVDADDNGAPSPGDTVRYRARLENTGSGIGRVTVRDTIPAEALDADVGLTGGGNVSLTDTELAVSDVIIPPEAAAEVAFDFVLADVPDRTILRNTVRFDSRPNGDAGSLQAPELVVRRDGDGDGVFDLDDNCERVPNSTQADADRDGRGDACDACPGDPLDDEDRDGLCGDRDNCPSTANSGQADADRDGRGNACDPCTFDPLDDADHDGACADVDNCPAVANPGQEDLDGDLSGDACDVCPRSARNDLDNDGTCDVEDNCPDTWNPVQDDGDRDGRGDSCDPCPRDAADDADADGLCADVDNCRDQENPGQENADGDARGDSCDPCPRDPDDDLDRDGYCADVDNCPEISNADQADVDRDGLGDICDRCPNDLSNELDVAGRCLSDGVEYVETNGCGCGGGVDAGLLALAVGLLFARRRRLSPEAARRLAVASALLLSACSGPERPRLASLAIAPEAPSIALGLEQRLVVTGTYTDESTRNLTADVAWEFGTPGVAKVEGGVLQGLAVGTSVLTARIGAVSGAVTITVRPAVATALDLTPAEASMARGSPLSFVASGVFSDGSTRDVTAEAAWESADAATVEVTGPGAVVAREIGRTVVRARLDGVLASARVTVTPAALVSLAVDPPQPGLPVGQRLALEATALYTDGTTQDVTASARWTSSDSGVLAVSNAVAAPGVVHGLQPGRARITARFLDAEAGVEVVVAEAALVDVEVSPARVRVPAGLTTAFEAIGRFSDDSVADLGAGCMWTSSDDAIASIEPSAPGTVHAIARGTSVITATCEGRSASGTLEVIDAELVGLEVDPASLSVARGLTRPLRLLGRYTDATVRDHTAVAAWTTADAEIASVSNAFATRGRVTALAEGSVAIRARAFDREATAELTVTSAELTSIELGPAAPEVRVGLDRAFTATGVYTDGSRQPLPDVTWSSDHPDVATVSNAAASRGLATGWAPGATTISAQWGGVVGAATLTVLPFTLDRLEVGPAGALAQGNTRRLVATAVYSDGASEPFTERVTWASSDEELATVSNATGNRGLTQAVSPGTVTISATFGPFNGALTFDITPSTLVSFTVSPSLGHCLVGETAAFTATGLFSDGATRDVTSRVQWASADPAVATVGATGAATGLAEGRTTITATGAGSTVSVLLDVLTRLPTALVVTPAAPTVAKGLTQAFVATAQFGDGSTALVTTLAHWTSSAPDIATIASTGVATALAVGPATIRASYGGQVGSAALTVGPAEVTGLTISPVSPQLTIGSTSTLAATAQLSDGTQQGVTSAATWSSSAGNIATVSSAGVVTGVAAGTASITADYAGRSASVTVTVRCTLPLVVNEVRTGTSSSASNEFIEIFNPCPLGTAPVALAGHRLLYRSAAGTSDTQLYSFGSSAATIAPRGYFVFGGSAYSGDVPANVNFASGLAAAGGGVALVNTAGTILDSVAWGTATNTFIETRAAPAPTDAAAPGKSIVRVPDGTDTNDNFADFRPSTAPTPGAPNLLQQP
jgi:uncharacterized protein YjdB